MAVLDPLDRQFLEVDRLCLFRYLHFLPSRNDVNSRSPLADEISVEAHVKVFVIGDYRPKYRLLSIHENAVQPPSRTPT
jgi:hypothetical protein